ncbi:hypothetical protein [Bradyrhizobium sp. WSM1417]|nr:hypothetical protein [Bradyrhizobium sp. WSM1417]
MRRPWACCAAEQSYDLAAMALADYLTRERDAARGLWAKVCK